MSQYPTEEMRRGRRRIEEISAITLLKDWTWDDATEQFYICFNICLEHDYKNIQKITEWYVTSTALYPFGPISIYPSCQNSITKTFPHQSINAFEEKNHLWRKGKLCVDLIDHTLGNRTIEREPFTTDERLYWNLQRAVLWVRAVSEDKLISNGDFFELPDFPINSNTVFAFQEDTVSMMIWEEIEESFGIAKVIRRDSENGIPVDVIHSYWSIDLKKELYVPAWGSTVKESCDYEEALWIKLSEVPVINGWQAPVDLGGLKDICLSQGLDLLEILKQFAPRARDKKHHLLLLGFPIPKRVGEDPYELTWQAIRLPMLSCGKYTNCGSRPGKKRSKSLTHGAARGFRPNEIGWWLTDQNTILKDSMELSWLTSENWSSRTIKGRGMLPTEFAEQRIAIIGLGSLGSAIAELLVRAGASHLTLIDGDILATGNLCRHTLGLTEIYHSKSQCIAERLINIDPNVRVKYVDEYLSLNDNKDIVPDMSKCDMIIDTTGEDNVLAMLSSVRWKHSVFLCSSSVGLGARRLYINLQHENKPDYGDFLKLTRHYFQKDMHDNHEELPRDGIGCWHPLFPARADDMWFAASTTVKAIESFMIAYKKYKSREISLIYRIIQKDNVFAGIRLIKKKYRN